MPSSQEEFFKAFNAQNLNAQQLYEHYFGFPPPDWTKQNAQQQNYAFNSQHVNTAFGNFLGELGKVGRAPAKPVLNKKSRIEQIQDELDIIRGRVPTPPGYKVSPSKIKALMAELKQLQTT